MATVKVPASINAYGLRDVTSELADFLNSLPDDTTAEFPKKGSYLCDGVVEVNDANGLVLDGNNSALATTATDDGHRAQLRLNGGRVITVKNLSTNGAVSKRNPANAFVEDLQWQHGVDARGVAGLVLTNVSVRDVYGDGFYFGTGAESAPCTDVIAHGCLVRNNGRQGVAAVHVNDLVFQFGVLDNISMMTFNVSPIYEHEVNRVRFSDNRVGVGPRELLLGIVGYGAIDDVSLLRNTVTQKPIKVLAESADENRRISNVFVSDNVSDTPLDGYMIDAHRVDYLQVTNNIQPRLSTGQYQSTLDCTNVEFAGNR